MASLSGFGRRSRRWSTGFALSLSLLACTAVAESPSQTPAVKLTPVTTDTEPEEINAFVACRQPAKRKEILLDTTRRQLHQTVCGAALWFDGLFGARDLAAAQSSYGRVEISTVYSQFEGYDTRLRFHARVRLPALEERLSAFVGFDDEDDFVRDRTEGEALRSQTQRVSDRDQFLAGLGFVAVTTDRFQSDFKIGVRNVRLPKFFVQNRLSYIPYSDQQSRIYLRTTPFWNNRDRFGVTTSSDMDRAIGQAFVLRWGNIGTISQVSAGFDWRSAVILYQNLGGGSALAYESFIRGATAAPEPLGEYGVRAIYRVPFLQERLFGELLLGYSWPRTDPQLPREGSAAIGLGVVMPFGEAPK